MLEMVQQAFVLMRVAFLLTVSQQVTCVHLLLTVRGGSKLR
jgi:hypothetical protein